ncbi:MAG: hypothetical protein H6667_24140 [Ardenticatenaceae bacterium]|nr:hypothetical protein [Ardenticatenaceae bacterium]
MRLQHITPFLRQCGWLILLGTAVAAITAYITSQNMTPVYEASATWLIDEPAKTEASVTAGQTLAQTYVIAAVSQPVLAETAERLDLPIDEEQLRGMVTAVVLPNTQLITINVEDSSPERAAAIANAIGQALADQSVARDSQRFAEPLANWQQQIDKSSAEIATLQSQLATADATNRSQLETDLAAAQAVYDNAFAQFNDLLTQQAGESVILSALETAEAPDTPIRPRTTAAVLLSAAAGGLAALIVAGIASRTGNVNQAQISSTVASPLTMTSND